MKILLFSLNASYTHTSLAIRCLRKPLEEAGFSVALLEKNLRDTDGDILEALYEEKADVYGFSCYIWNIDRVCRYATDLKALLPGCRILFGGPEVSFDTERFFSLPVDCFLLGEGEKAVVSVCRKIEKNEAIPKCYAEPSDWGKRNEGILYRDGDFPDGDMVYYESSRGCPYRCAYCLSSVGDGIRMKTVQETLSDLQAFETLSTKIKIVKFVDRTFNADVERANDLWEALLSEQYTKHYHFEVCANLLNERSFAILKKMPEGKIQLEFGLQSTNGATLSAVSRHINAEKTIEAVDRIYRFGNIHVHLDLIAGLPYEDYATFRRSFDNAYGHCHQLQLGFLKLLHGTGLYENRNDYGYTALSHAPYTVLKSNWMTREELYRLEGIADLLERYPNSDSFTETFAYLNPLMPSPFDFFEGLLDEIRQKDGRNVRKISQNDAFRLLFSYAVRTLPCKEEILRKKAETDFRKKEIRRMPVLRV